MFAVILAVGASLFTGGAGAYAALTVSPSRVVLKGHPSQVLVGFFAVKNEGDAPMQVMVEPEDWSSGVQGARGSVGWMTVQPTRLSIRPGKTARVKYRIRIPKEASGELRTQVFFTTDVTEGSMPMRSRLGTIIYVGIEGTEHIEAAIRGVDDAYTASTPGVARPDRPDFVLAIQNLGNTHIVPEGQVVVHDQDGEVAATVPLPPGWGLLPNEEDGYHAMRHGIHLKPGRYTVEVAIACGSDLRAPTTVTRTLEAVVTDEGHLNLLESSAPGP